MKKLQRNEMKQVSGGAPPPPRTLWYCYIGSGQYANVCYSVNPEVPCEYGAGACVSLGTNCNANRDLCTIPI